MSYFFFYLENLTNEQYSGIVPRSINALSASRDTLNPLLNTTVLKNRLADIEHFKYLHGEKYARWPAFWMAGSLRDFLDVYREARHELMGGYRANDAERTVIMVRESRIMSIRHHRR